MTDVTTTYRGHTIRWSDNADEWTCFDLSDKVRSSPKLSILKGHIDRLYLAERKAASTPCYELSHGGQKTASNVVEYLKAKVHPAWGPASNRQPERTEHVVAVVAHRSGSERPARRETSLDKLMPDTPEALAAWAEFDRLDKLAKEANRKATDALAAIPRLQLADVQKLVDLAKAAAEDAP